MEAHHPVFQLFHIGPHLGSDPKELDHFVTSPFYDRTVGFCPRYDEVSFDPDGPGEPLSTFEPMVRRVLDRDGSPPR